MLKLKTLFVDCFLQFAINLKPAPSLSIFTVTQTCRAVRIASLPKKRKNVAKSLLRPVKAKRSASIFFKKLRFFSIHSIVCSLFLSLILSFINCFYVHPGQCPKADCLSSSSSSSVIHSFICEFGKQTHLIS